MCKFDDSKQRKNLNYIRNDAIYAETEEAPLLSTHTQTKTDVV